MRLCSAMSSRARQLLCLLLLAAAAAPVCAGELNLDGVLFGRALAVRGPRSWLEGGFGRLGESGGGPADFVVTGRAQAHLGLDYRPSLEWLIHAHGLAQSQPARAGGRELGLTEAFVAYRPELSPRLALHLRAGLFFPQTSRENVERLWSSPYTITLSALNSWIGEEVRLAGVEAGVVRKSDRHELQLFGGAFGANDPSGSLLAWRGFAMGDRLVTPGESLPLPPLRSLGASGAFSSQRRDGTRPIDELDDRVGWSARARWERRDAVLLQAAYLDNRGDRELHRGQYAWRTRFAQAGLELHLAKGLLLIGEIADGQTGMGERSRAHVDLDFRTGYALLTWGGPRLRVSARYDRFRNLDRDGTAEPNGEDGSAYTLAGFFSPRPWLRVGAEYLELRAQRAAAADAGESPNTDGRRGTLELRLLF